MSLLVKAKKWPWIEEVTLKRIIMFAVGSMSLVKGWAFEVQVPCNPFIPVTHTVEPATTEQDL